MVYSVKTTPEAVSVAVRTVVLEVSSQGTPSTVPASALSDGVLVGGVVSIRASETVDQALQAPKASAVCTRQDQSPSASAGDRQVSAAESTAPLSAATAVKAGGGPACPEPENTPLEP